MRVFAQILVRKYIICTQCSVKHALRYCCITLLRLEAPAVHLGGLLFWPTFPLSPKSQVVYTFSRTAFSKHTLDKNNSMTKHPAGLLPRATTMMLAGATHM